MPFSSILFDRPPGAHAPAEPEPALLADLDLGQVVASVTSGDRDYLRPLFDTPLGHPESVRYRQDVMRDLCQDRTRDAVETFSLAMRSARDLRKEAGASPTGAYAQRLFLDAASRYCRAVTSLSSELGDISPGSRGLREFRDHLAEYVARERFASLDSDTRLQYEALASVRYTVHIDTRRVTVGRYEGEPDYGAEVVEAFSHSQHDADSSPTSGPEMWSGPNRIEARVLELLPKLFPHAFSGLDDYCRKYADPFDPTLERFDREVQFYLAFLELMEPLSAAGLSFCFPDLATEAGEVSATGAYDLALACRSLPDGAAVVTNGFRLEHPERVMVVTGPNQGGKTTFARMVGQLHFFAALGLPIAAEEARLCLPDRILTHFERQERWETTTGKLEDELMRARHLLAQATSRSIVIINEGLAATTYRDARFLGTEVLRRVRTLDSLCVFVTFVDELATLDEAVVSMVAGVDPSDPSTRTFRILRGPPSGSAYATAIADKYRLGYETLRGRLPC